MPDKITVDELKVFMGTRTGVKAHNYFRGDGTIFEIKNRAKYWEMKRSGNRAKGGMWVEKNHMGAEIQR